MRQIRALLLLLLCLPVAPVGADPVGGLFEAEVPVSGQDTAARDAAIRAAFKAVLIKLAGSRRALENEALAAALPKAGNYLVQFYFRSAALPPGEDGSSTPQTLLHASFQAGAVQELMRRAGEPVLSANRPGTLVWLAIDDGSGSRRLVNRDTDPVAAGWLDHHATARAVPLLYPVLDLEESMAVTPDLVWNQDEAALLAASQRYGTQSLLAGRLARTGTGEWIGEWRARIGEEQLAGQGRAATLAELDGQLVDFVAENLTGHFAIRANLENAEELRIRVDGIRDYATYRQLAGLLGKLGSVRQARPALFEGETVFFDLLTDSGIDSVLQELALIGQLQRDGSAERNFHWAGDSR
jgi:hypothetical protein